MHTAVTMVTMHTVAWLASAEFSPSVYCVLHAVKSTLSAKGACKMFILSSIRLQKCLRAEFLVCLHPHSLSLSSLFDLENCTQRTSVQVNSYMITQVFRG